MTSAATSSTPLLVVGSLNMDLVMRVPRIPEAGETLTGYGFDVLPGGKGANQAVACARLGSSVEFVGRIGKDAFGNTLRDAMQADGIATEHLTVDPAAATGVAMILVDDAAQNRITLAPGANATLSPACLDAAQVTIDHAALMVLQLEVPLAVVADAAQRAKRAGCPVLLNPAPAQALPDSLWPLIDYLVPNESEASLLTGVPVCDPESAAQAARLLLARGVRHVLITLGSQGVVAATPEQIRHLPATPVEAVDTTAAGDTFIGGFAAGLLEGLSLEQAVRLGQAAAALCVTRPGAQPAIPYRAEIGDLDRQPAGRTL